jgi:hypothetical protein
LSPLLQFTLTFVTLVVLATILYVRLTRYDAYLREEKEGIHRLNERLQALVDGLESLGTRSIERQLTEIHDVLAAIRDGLGRPIPTPLAPSSPEPATRQLTLQEVIEAKLSDLGFRRVAIVTDLSGVDRHQPVRVVVEGEKDGVAHKGHLLLSGSEVTELAVTPNYTAFP